MAVTTTNRVAGPFTGNGATVQFSFSFKVFAATDLLVVSSDTMGNVAALNLGADYTATLNANQDVSAGGSITMTTAPAAGTLLVITSNVAELQQVVLANLGGFYPDVLNGVFDRLTILVQQLQATASRSLQFPVTDTTAAVLPSALQRANSALAFDENGAIKLVTLPSDATVLAMVGPPGTVSSASGLTLNEMNGSGVPTGHSYLVQIVNGTLTWTQTT